MQKDQCGTASSEEGYMHKSKLIQHDQLVKLCLICQNHTISTKRLLEMEKQTPSGPKQFSLIIDEVIRN